MTHKIYYRLKPLIPRSKQIGLRQLIARVKYKKHKDVWPINAGSSRQPEGWQGWPHKKQFALVLTHDVETQRGRERCLHLMDLERTMGFRSAFFFVPKKYDIPESLQNKLRINRFEIGIHGLCHDGRLFQSRKIFQKRSALINQIIQEWKVSGFRSPSTHRNLDWIHDLDIAYDASTFDTDPFEPQPEGMGTIFPFVLKSGQSESSYIELPYTLPQDFTLFILLKQKQTDIWKTKLDWIAKKGGMALIVTHPDYMNFNGRDLSVDEYPADFYSEFLSYIKDKYGGRYWNVLPEEMAQYWSDTMTDRNTLGDGGRQS